MFDWDQDFDEVVTRHSLPGVQAAHPVAQPTGRIRRALLALGVPAIAMAALLAAPSFAPADTRATFAAFGFSRLAMDPGMPEGLLSYDQAQYDNFRHGIARFSDSELLAFAAATRRDQANPRLTPADWDLDALRLTDLEIVRRGLQPASVTVTLTPIPAAPEDEA